MGQETIDKTGGYVPTKKQMQAIDRNFTEVYGLSDAGNAAAIAANVDAIAVNAASIVELKAGDGITLTEYADNAAAVTGGLTLGDLYMTTGAVKVVTA